MKIISMLLTALAVVVAVAGCTSLTDKAVVLDTSVKGFKVTTGADANSGTPMPNLSAGWGSNLLITMPTDKNSTLEYDKSSGSLFGEIFGIEVTDKTSVRMTAGDNKIKVETETDQNKKVITEVGGGIVTVNVKDGIVATTATGIGNVGTTPASLGNESGGAAAEYSGAEPKGGMAKAEAEPAATK